MSTLLVAANTTTFDVVLKPVSEVRQMSVSKFKENQVIKKREYKAN